MRGRRLRWVVVGTILAIGLYFVFDVAALNYMESRGAAQIARTMTAESATVDLGNVPFLPGFIRGRVAHAEVDVRGASAARGLRVQTVRARLNDVRFDWRSIFALVRSRFAPRTEVEISDPFGAFEVGQADLEDYLRRHIARVAEVRISSGGIEVRFVQDVPADENDLEEGEEDMVTEPARFLPRIENGRFVLTLVGIFQLPPAFRSDAQRIERIIELPDLPGELRTDVRLGDGVVIVEATGTELQMTVGEGEG